MATVSDSTLDGYNSRRRPRRSLSSRNPSSSSSSSSQWSHILRSNSDCGAIPAALKQQEVDAEKPNCSSLQAVTENCDGGTATTTKKQAWNKPSNEVVELGSSVVNDVMGELWPALSESARISPKSSSNALKALGEGSVAAASSPASSTSQGPVIPSSPPKSPKLDSNDTNYNSMHNHNTPVSAESSNLGWVSSIPVIETARSASESPAVVGVDSSPRDFTQKNNNWETGSGLHQPHVGNDQRRNSFRRVNSGGSRHRGGGNGRREQDRSNFEWNLHQNFSGNDMHMQQKPRGFVRPSPPPTPPPFISPPPIRAYAPSMGFPDLRSPLYYVTAPPPESLSGVVPYVAHAVPPGMFISAPDPQLRAMLIKQIDYYFSSENLCKDVFLRQNMDEQGWVPISLIASFNRVKQLTIYFPFILDAVRSSATVEVQGDKIRKRNDWMNWLLPAPNPFGAVMTGPQSPNYDTLVTRMQNVGLDGTVNHNNSHALSVQPNQLRGHSGILKGEEKGQTSVQVGSNLSE